MDHVRRVGELQAARRQRRVRRAHVVDREVQDRVGRRALAFGQEQAHATAVEEGQVAERVEVREPEHLAVPGACRGDVAHVARDLAQRAQLDVVAHGELLPEEMAVAPHAVPAPQLGATREPQLLQRVGHVVLHGVQADALARRDLAIAQPVSHGLDDTPFGGRQDIGVRRAAAIARVGHGGSLAAGAANFPTRPCARDQRVLRLSWNSPSVAKVEGTPLSGNIDLRKTVQPRIAMSAGIFPRGTS